MEDRKEDEDGDPRSRQIHSFSQPLAIKSNAISLDNNDPDPSPFYPHYRSSSTDNNYQIHQRYQIRNPNPNLPIPIPPHHHHSVSSSGSLISRHRHRHDSSSFSSDGAKTLDRAMSEFGGAAGTLPEFMGKGGGTGIFQVPVRSAMHPARQPGLELRPHPRQETQFSTFLRTILCTEMEIWARQESGLRHWKLDEVFDGWSGRGGVKRGDKESAPFKEARKTSGTMSMVVDLASGLMWSGHKDGRFGHGGSGMGRAVLGTKRRRMVQGFILRRGLHVRRIGPRGYLVRL